MRTEESNVGPSLIKPSSLSNPVMKAPSKPVSYLATPVKEIFLGGSKGSAANKSTGMMFTTPSAQTRTPTGVPPTISANEMSARVAHSDAKTEVKPADQSQLWHRDTSYGMSETVPAQRPSNERDTAAGEEFSAPTLCASPKSVRSSAALMQSTAGFHHFHERPAIFNYDTNRSIEEAVPIPVWTSGTDDEQKDGNESSTVFNGSHDANSVTYPYQASTKTATDWLFDSSIMSQNDSAKAPYQTPTRVPLPSPSVADLGHLKANNPLYSTPVHPPKLLFTGTPVISAKSANSVAMVRQDGICSVLVTPQTKRRPEVPDTETTVNRQRPTSAAVAASAGTDYENYYVNDSYSVQYHDATVPPPSIPEDFEEETGSILLPSPQLPPRPYVNTTAHPFATNISQTPMRRVYDARNGSF
jgi:hypothetical protein